MKVRQLIELLEYYDDDCEVMLMTQESWPFENTIEGVTQREDFDDDDESSENLKDVFIVEGSQIRYGSKDAWNTLNY